MAKGPMTPAQQLERLTRERMRTTGRSREIYTTSEGKVRYNLLNPTRARKSARQRQGRRIARNAYDDWINPPNPKAGENLQKGIMGMAIRAGFEDGDITYIKLSKMNPDKLYDLYAKNELIFDVAFNYHGADNELDMDTKKGMRVIPGKKKDLEFLVEQYEKAYGEIVIK